MAKIGFRVGWSFLPSLVCTKFEVGMRRCGHKFAFRDDVRVGRNLQTQLLPQCGQAEARDLKLFPTATTNLYKRSSLVSKYRVLNWNFL